MNKHFLIAMALMTLCSGGIAQQTAKVEIKVALVDAELNPKPVPKLTLNIERTLDKTSAPQKVVTGFDGIARIELPLGVYRLISSKPTVFLGKQYTWSKEFTTASGGVKIELSNDNANIADAEKPTPAAAGDDLTALFRRLKPSIVTVLAEVGRAQGTGFIIDDDGLIVTNEHVVGHSPYIAVQFDPQHKLPAVLLASDKQKDIAVLGVNLSPVRPQVSIARVDSDIAKAPPVEGARVFTIGNPLNKEKILTTGIVSKVAERSILSDININPGNSGGPLFDMRGLVIGVTTFGESAGSGPGVSGIVRIETAIPLIAQAKTKLKTTPVLSTRLLPVEPVQPFPMDALKASLLIEKFDYRPYRLSAGDFDIELSTPISSFRGDEEDRLRAERGRQKRSRKQGAESSPGESEHLRDWESDAERYKAVLTVYIFPKLRETKGSRWGRILLAPNMPATKRFKTDFYSLRMVCGSKEIEPIFPGRVKVDLDAHNAAVNVEDSVYFGVYSYDASSISPQCGQVTFQVSPSQGGLPTSKLLEATTVERVWQDFEPYRRTSSASSK